MARRSSTRPTTAERALLRQLGEARALQKSIHSDQALVSATAAVHRLSAEYETCRAARLAGAERDPILRAAAMRDMAEQAGSWTAARRLAADVEHLKAEAAAKLAAATPTKTAADLSPEEWTAHLVGVARSLGDDDLDVFLSEWARRNRRVFVVENDEVRAVRTG